MRRHISINVFYLHLNSFMACIDSSCWAHINTHTGTNRNKPKKIGLNEHKQDVIKHFTEFSCIFVCYLSNKNFLCVYVVLLFLECNIRFECVSRQPCAFLSALMSSYQ